MTLKNFATITYHAVIVVLDRKYN